MHQSIVTTAPPQVRGYTGDSRGNGPCFYLPGGPAVLSECGGFVFTPKIAGNGPWLCAGKYPFF